VVIRLSRLKDDAEKIHSYIECESISRTVAENFVDKLTDYCEQLAKLPGLLGRARPEFGRGYRSVTFGSYMIFMRYADEARQPFVMEG
jgi:toxin ParE1/3/4